MCVCTQKMLRSSVFSFSPSWIWAIRVSSHSQSHELQKWHPLSKRPCFALNGQNNLWGRFDERKKRTMFCSVCENWKTESLPVKGSQNLSIVTLYLYSRDHLIVLFDALHKKKIFHTFAETDSEIVWLLNLRNAPFPEFAKSSRRSLEMRDWREFSPFIRREYKKCTSGKKHRFFIFY